MFRELHEELEAKHKQLDKDSELLQTLMLINPIVVAICHRLPAFGGWETGELCKLVEEILCETFEKMTDQE